MRIVHLLPQVRLGVGRLVVDLAASQAARRPAGAVAIVVSDDADDPWRSDPELIDEALVAGVVVRRPGNFFTRALPSLRTAAERLRAAEEPCGPWVAHAHTAMAAAVARWAGARAVVATCYGVGPQRPAAFDLQDALAWSTCEVVSTASEAWRTRLQSTFGLSDVELLPGGINPQRVPTPLPPSERRQLITVAELTDRKGVDLAMAAVRRLPASLGPIAFVVIGRGDAEAALREAASAMPPHVHVTFAGHVRRPPALFRASDIFVLASREDNQPVAVIEAMMAGLPPVVTDVGGLGEMVRASGGGFVVPPENVDALTDAIVRAWTLSADARHAMGRVVRDHALAEYSIARAVDVCDRLYATALAGEAARWPSGADSRRLRGACG